MKIVEKKNSKKKKKLANYVKSYIAIKTIFIGLYILT